jgi:predicted MFS family arabinose efflux permease
VNRRAVGGGTDQSRGPSTPAAAVLSSVPARLVGMLVPRRLGTNFRWLLSSTVVNNLGDGIALAAGPLLVASLTRDAFLVSMALTAQWLPMLLFGMVGGVAADRLDRRRMVVVVNLARAGVLLTLAALIVTDTLTIAWALTVLFVLGTAETFADSASSTLLPSLVARKDLGVANARMQGAFLLANQMVAPPIGAALFAAGMALPFAANAAGFALGATLISRIVGSMRSERTEAAGVWADTVEGLRWLVGHPPMRTLTLTIFAFNVTFGAGWSVLVLYAGERLGMGEVGFGLLMTAVAIGGVIGTISYGALERRFRLASLLRVGVLVETGTHLSLALTTAPAVAMATLVVFGAHAFVWGTLFTVVRQRAVPNPLLGRVTGVYRVANRGGLVLGAPLGGVLARSFGITAPFWFGFIGSALLVVLLWRQFVHIAHAGEA